MKITVTLSPVRMVGPVWMIMVATHVSALINGLVKTVQVSVILILNGVIVWTTYI